MRNPDERAAPSPVLLIGASGQLGRALAHVFVDRRLVTASHLHPGPSDLTADLGDSASLRQLADRVRPDLILIAGAMCNVDRCEQDEALCMRVNVEGPRTLAEWSHESGARVVFFSTDHVFDGTRASYAETDAVSPLNVYSRSKALAEEAVRGRLPERHLIIRTSWVYGPDEQRRNFALRLVDNVSARQCVPVPADQSGSPTLTDDLADVTRRLVDSGACGTFHATGPRLMDRMTLAEAICREFQLSARYLVPRATAELSQVARRPERVLLTCDKLIATGAAAFRDIAEGLPLLRAWNDDRMVNNHPGTEIN